MYWVRLVRFVGVGRTPLQSAREMENMVRALVSDREERLVQALAA
jgi:hypothetical protein